MSTESPTLNDAPPRGIFGWFFTVFSFIFGCMLGVAVADREASDWLFRWSTLIAGVFALAGAAVTVWQIRKQISQSQMLSDRERDAESYAARSILPLALSEICEYSASCLKQQKAIFDAIRTGDNPDIVFPKLSPSLIGYLRDAVRYSKSPYAKKIADLIAHFQVQQARLRDLQEEVLRRGASGVFPPYLDQAILDAAEVYALASSLFDYARRQEEGERPTASIEAMASALRINGFNPEEAESTYRLLRAYENRP
ncbi:MAG: hypothetical protein J0I16_07665 [Rhizobiales bacterium]|nr:hypothetical protein [Hyphomicrobiales bacterium]